MVPACTFILYFYGVLKMVLYRFYILVGHCRKMGLRVLRDVSLKYAWKLATQVFWI